MSDTQENVVDNATETVAPSTPAAPPSGSDTSGSAPGSVDTTASEQAKPESAEEAERRQSRNASRAFSSMRRQIQEQARELGRLQGLMEARAPAAQQDGQPASEGKSEVERLRQEMAQRETERVSRTFWSSAEKEAKDKGLTSFVEARDAIQNGEVPTTPVMSHYITNDADNKAALVVWLADNPEEAERIANLDPVRAGAALAKADARLSAKPSPRTPGAPPPPKTVGGSAVATVSPAKMSMDEYAKWRRAQS